MSTPRATPEPLTASLLAGVIGATVLGLGLRLLWVLKLHPPSSEVFSDMQSYVDRARHLLAGRYDSGDWLYPPGTSAPLALWMKLTPFSWQRSAAVMQAVLAAAEIPLIFIGARRWFGNRVALMAAASFSIYYLAIDYAGLFSSEVYLTFWLVLAVALLDPDRPVRMALAGLALGLGALAKPQVMLLAPMWFGLLAMRRQWNQAAALTAACAAVVLPASIICTRATGHLQVLSSTSGVVMVQAWCPVKDVEAHSSAWSMAFGLPTVSTRIGRGEQEAMWGHARYDVPFTDSGFYMREGLRCIARFPAHALRTLALNLWDTFGGPPWSFQGPWPDAATDWRKPTLWCNQLFSWLVVPFAFLGMWRHRRDRGMLFAVTLPVASCIVTCLVFHGEPRFRVPYDFAILVGAWMGLASMRRSREVAPVARDAPVTQVERSPDVAARTSA
ncbi:MAG: glycosyltransferase family 39 protein [Deltaproteobacteria bacterium]|nr:glycosyltransferase family 39 protein [Deltaproteobacteria bacterium]